ncbi:hypothetical protein B0T22DRAFT_499519 [Podospora appendiculata]|uniref:NAD(P)-binding protein n=1 Tax=Podospora appendiculata TaxID=314037 RepID=A0AAE0XC62_9PEZI|nr:hypothetical protein B0T22DRAFT_499519 [Podospora appendiculata]
MAEIFYSDTTAQLLERKVVVLTGGAQGIGAATVTLLHELGSHVFFGDWSQEHGHKLEQDLLAKGSANGGSVHFRQLDVRNYQAQLALFDAAHAQHGRVDAAISCAAVSEPGGWFEPQDLNLDTVRNEPTPITASVEINLTSVIHFTRLALAYMKPTTSLPPSSPFSKSITLISSIAGISPAPGLFSYSSAKHGIIGLTRALAPWAPVKYSIRANAICPWATDTQLLAGVKARWTAEKMPLNAPADVARYIVQCAADDGLNGKAVLVAGGRGFDTEEGIETTLGVWMGEENAVAFQRGQEILGLGDSWTNDESGKTR